MCKEAQGCWRRRKHNQAEASRYPLEHREAVIVHECPGDGCRTRRPAVVTREPGLRAGCALSKAWNTQSIASASERG